MAYNLEDRFSPPPKYFTLLDPGAYNSYITPKPISKCNKTPFLSNTSRNTQSGIKIWTHTIYYADYPTKIPNCTSFMSKTPRFPYEIFSKKDLNELLCRCGIETPCQCLTEKEHVVCQAKIKRRLFKGHPPRSIIGKGLSSSSKSNYGFHVLNDERVAGIQDKITDASPPFYDTNVRESTSFYRGCKWSKWTSSRSTKTLNSNPGPAHYTLTRKPTRDENCAEKLRSYKRQTSKQLRFIQIVQQRNILEDRPGPANYSPLLPNGYQIKYLGPKSNRFSKKQYDQQPGPADYWVRRDFDPIKFSGYSCHAKLPELSCFGVKAVRFRTRKEEGPSPASYFPRYELCNYVRCATAPFGASAQRFNKIQLEESDQEEFVDNSNKNNVETGSCLLPSWQFRSNTVRMRSLVKKLNEPSPADRPQAKALFKKSQRLQHTAPFSSSEGRFQPWYNWIPVHGKLNTPGPSSYCLDKPKCYPAVHSGPLFRAKRFPSCELETPSPNKYNVGGNNIDNILNTHNKILKHNVNNQHKFIWKSPVERRKLSFEEQENVLLNNSISLLDANNINEKYIKPCDNKNNGFVGEKEKVKLLRCFLYNKQMTCF